MSELDRLRNYVNNALLQDMKPYQIPGVTVYLAERLIMELESKQGQSQQATTDA